MSLSSQDLDIIIDHLKTQHGADCQLDKGVISRLCLQTREEFTKQPMLLKLKAPLNVVGDVHGQFNDLLRIFEICGEPPETNYLFLGDYVDRGKQSLETICLLFAYMLRYPKQVYLLRGNHECASINKLYGKNKDGNRLKCIDIDRPILLSKIKILNKNRIFITNFLTNIAEKS